MTGSLCKHLQKHHLPQRQKTHHIELLRRNVSALKYHSNHKPPALFTEKALTANLTHADLALPSFLAVGGLSP